MSSGPLEGVTVVDLTRALAGPNATLILAHDLAVQKGLDPGSASATRGEYHRRVRRGWVNTTRGTSNATLPVSKLAAPPRNMRIALGLARVAARAARGRAGSCFVLAR